MAEDAATVTAEAGPAVEEASASPPVGLVFEVLADRRDRYALYHLRRRDGVADLDVLARQVLAWESAGPAAAVDDGAAAAAAEEFASSRLPRLRRAGLVEFNPRTGCVVFTTAGEGIATYLDAAMAEEPIPADPPDPFVY